MDWAQIWNSIKNFFTNNIWSIVTFFAVLIIGIIIIKVLMNMFRHILKATSMEKIAQHFILAIVKFCLYLFLILILLRIVGIELTGILTAISALMLAVGMALQNNISNLANGIILVSTHMFKKGDYIIVDGQEGNITEINFLFTTLMTSDNKKVTLPNSVLVNSSVVNAGANAKRRINFTFSVAYESDVEQVKKIVTDVMKSDGRVYLDPAPFCRLKNLGASSIDFFANCWADNEDYWNVYYYVLENVYNEFKRANISVPYNQLEIRDRKDEVVMPFNKQKLPERVEKVRKQEKKHLDLETMDISKIFKNKRKKTDSKINDKNKKEQKQTNKKTKEKLTKEQKLEKKQIAKEEKLKKQQSNKNDKQKNKTNKK